MRVFAILNQKGGSGKTTTTVNLGAALAELGRQVLILDLDPQASATHWLGAGEGDGIYQVIVDRLPVGPFVTHTAIDGLDLVPASKKLALVEQDARRKPGGESALRRAIAKLSVSWDFVLMDCPPALGLLTINAMAAADSVIVPVEAHGIALERRAPIAEVRDMLDAFERLDPFGPHGMTVDQGSPTPRAPGHLGPISNVRTDAKSARRFHRGPLSTDLTEPPPRLPAHSFTPAAGSAGTAKKGSRRRRSTST